MSSGRDASHLMPEDESCFHHLPITAGSVQVSPYSEVRGDDSEAERKRWACPTDLNRLIHAPAVWLADANSRPDCFDTSAAGVRHPQLFLLKTLSARK